MFDKMIVSDADAARDRGRTRYFIVTGLIVGTLFFSAVVLSIYAVDLNLGTESFELSMMMAPVTPDEPEPPRPDPPRDQPRARQNDTPIRNTNTLRVEEYPSVAPETVSVEKPTSLARPPGPFRLDPNAGEVRGVGIPDGLVRGRGDGTSPGSSSFGGAEPAAAVAEKLPDPPPVLKPKPTGPISLGVVNGKATDLPKPPYPAAAIAMNAEGEVTVQVLIDELGKVISAKAVSGHPLLKREAEKAAFNARFSPTTLSKVPVKVTGVIVYNFKRH